MADDKKAGPPKAPALAGWKPLDVLIVLFVLAAILGALATAISSIFSGGNPTFFGFPLYNIKNFFFDNAYVFKFLSFFFSAVFLVGIIYLSLLRGEIWKAERAKLFPAGEMDSSSGKNIEVEDEIKKKWQRIISLSESLNESDWRMAIVEADIILDELLWKIGLPGETMGDKLKAVEKSDFLTLDEAWEAHKVRNRIAHGGSLFQLNQREVRATISLYEKVFKEFYLI